MAKNINIEDAKILFRNFSGTRFTDGKRTFSVQLSDEDAEALKAEGWNVKTFEARDGNVVHHLPCEIRFQKNPEMEHYNPSIWWITDTRRTKLSERAVSNLDQAEIAKVDLVIRPYNYSKKFKIKDGEPFIKAQVKSMYVTVIEDSVDAKYAMLEHDGRDDNRGFGDTDDSEVPFDV